MAIGVHARNTHRVSQHRPAEEDFVSLCRLIATSALSSSNGSSNSSQRHSHRQRSSEVRLAADPSPFAQTGYFSHRVLM